MTTPSPELVFFDDLHPRNQRGEVIQTLTAKLIVPVRPPLADR